MQTHSGRRICHIRQGTDKRVGERGSGVLPRSPPPPIFTEGNSQRLRGQCKNEIQAATLDTFLIVFVEAHFAGESIRRQRREHLQEVVKEQRWPISLKETSREVSSSWLNSQSKGLRMNVPLLLRKLT